MKQRCEVTKKGLGVVREKGNTVGEGVKGEG